MKIRLSLHLVVASALAGTALLLTLSPHDRRPMQTDAEVPSKNLVRRDGRWFLPDGTNLFTGWLFESYPDGTRQARSAVSNGKLNGLSEGWYPSGQIQIREHFRDNVSSGLRQKWYANGALMSEANVVEGNLQGIFQRWFENGRLAEWIEMKDGKPDGLALAYYPTGFLQARTRTSQGTILNQETWKDGEHKEPLANSGEQATTRTDVAFTFASE